jgi:PBP1b-binding outer membrane lipoprotein LpoB
MVKIILVLLAMLFISGCEVTTGDIENYQRENPTAVRDVTDVQQIYHIKDGKNNIRFFIIKHSDGSREYLRVETKK